MPLQFFIIMNLKIQFKSKKSNYSLSLLVLLLSVFITSYMRAQTLDSGKESNDTTVMEEGTKPNINAPDGGTEEFKTDYFSRLVPVSPNAASLGRYVSLPVDNYTGIANISIPLFDLKSRQLSLPISLTYHSGGTKVEDIASWVGMGWTLQAGGAIIREVNGLPDELPEYGFFETGEDIGNFPFLTDDEKKTWIKRSQELTYDTEPDVFYFNFNGRTGKIIFDHNQKPRVIPHQSLDVTYVTTDNKISEFTIITEDGVKYIFGRNTSAIEETKFAGLPIPIGLDDYTPQHADCNGNWYYILESSTDPGINYNGVIPASNKLTEDYFNSTWYLSRMESPINDYIDFTYTSNGEISYVTQPKIIELK